jgi:HSP20 family protein
MVIIMYNDINDLFSEMDKALKEVYKDIKNPILVDVEKGDDAYYVEANLAGVNKEDVKLSMENDKLTISVENRKEDGNEKKFILNERVNGFNPRTIYLKNSDSKNVRARMENGVLYVTVPFIKHETSSIVID